MIFSRLKGTCLFHDHFSENKNFTILTKIVTHQVCQLSSCVYQESLSVCVTQGWAECKSCIKDIMFLSKCYTRAQTS